MCSWKKHTSKSSELISLKLEHSIPLPLRWKFRCGTWHDFSEQAVLLFFFSWETAQDDESTKVNDAHWSPSTNNSESAAIERCAFVNDDATLVVTPLNQKQKERERERARETSRRYVDEMNVSANSSESKISINTVSNNGCVYFFVSNFYEGIVLSVYIRFHWNAPEI